MKIRTQLQNLKSNNLSGFALLIDPDKTDPTSVSRLAELCNTAGVNYVFFGGSLVVKHNLDSCIQAFKKNSSIPVLLFPGSPDQISTHADALLYLSLISGRNPELLIGQHVVSAPKVRASGLEILSTGYMVIDGGVPTTVSYMSHSAPLPANKPDIALCTAWASEMLGQSVLYMDAGSGAQNPVPINMISTVAQNTGLPLIVGGGIRRPEQALAAVQAGANIIVVGNAVEKNPGLIQELCQASQTVVNAQT